MMDANYIIKSIDKINIGVDTNIKTRCPHCGADYVYAFPFTGEFFGPEID